MKRSIVGLCYVLLLVIVVPALLNAQATGSRGNPGVVPPGSKTLGLTYGEWSARWWEWAFSIPKSVHPLAAANASCSEMQTGGGKSLWTSSRPAPWHRMPILFWSKPIAQLHRPVRGHRCGVCTSLQRYSRLDELGGRRVFQRDPVGQHLLQHLERQWSARHFCCGHR